MCCLRDKIAFMKNPILALAILTFIIVSCEKENMETVCTIPATVRNLEGLDGCGYVFELDDNTKLIPVWEMLWCGTPPMPKEVTEDPLFSFEFVDGKRVMINYTEIEAMNICMAGKTVKITCLKEFPITPDF